MKIMKDLWEKTEYRHLELTSQNLRDQAARVEKTLCNVQQTIRQNVGRRNRLRSRGVNQENVGRTGEETTRETANMPELETASNLHSETHNTEEGDEAQKEQTSEANTSGELTSSEENSEIIELVESACIILASIVHPQGDLCERDVDTRIKEKPTNRDIDNINKAIGNVMKKNKVSEIDQQFVYLWMANCILYAVVVAFLLAKNWKKNGNSQTKGRGKNKVFKRRENYDTHVKELRRRISIAKAEMERLQKNRKITKKGKKNRLELQKECQIISAASLVNYMKKKKSDLRKLKKAYWRREKQQKSRAQNRKFELDPGRVYAGIKEIVDKNGEEKRPKYVETSKENEGSQHSFENIEEASSFWKALWEKEGSGDISAKWVEEVKSAINSRVAAPTDEQFLLTKEEAVNAIRTGARSHNKLLVEKGVQLT